MSLAKRRIDLVAITRNSVLGADRSPVGHVREFILDESDGRIEFATLVLEDGCSGRPLEVAVPWSQFTMARSGDCLLLDISLRVLRSVATRRLEPLR